MAAAKQFSVIFKILLVVVAMAALLFSSGEATKYGLCRSTCLDIEPNCFGWCKQIGYPKGGECLEPVNKYCCCYDD